MGLFSRHQRIPTFKVGERVCFLFQKDTTKLLEKEWYIGEIVRFPLVKEREKAVAEISVYDLSLVKSRSSVFLDECACSDPVPFAVSLEVIVRSILSTHSALSFSRLSKNVIVPLDDLLKGTEYDFLRALEKYHVSTLNGKLIYY